MRDREEFLGSRYLHCRIGPRSTEVFEAEAFIRRERAQRILLVTGHGTLRGRRDGEYLPHGYAHYHGLAITKPSDPLIHDHGEDDLLQHC
jgi:hypothetical protein